MPERPEYTTDYVAALFPLDLNCQLRHRINAERGRVTGFVVQLEIEIDGEVLPVVRYDCAHGQPHRDVLDYAGTVIEKDWLPFDFDRALAHAVQDIRANWQRYRSDFLQRMP